MEKCNEGMKVYCDESYSTGSDVFNKEQTHFAYGCYILDEKEINNIIQLFKINPQKEEKKYIEPHILYNIIQKNNIRYHLYFADKVYSLACNIIHWIIDEILYYKKIDMTSFYKDDLHSYFANFVYCCWKGERRQEDLEIIHGLYKFLSKNDILY